MVRLHKFNKDSLARGDHRRELRDGVGEGAANERDGLRGEALQQAALHGVLRGC